MKTETQGKIKYGVWGLIVGTVITMIIGFGWGGWTTAATTQKISDEAVLAIEHQRDVRDALEQDLDRRAFLDRPALLCHDLG